MAIEIKVPVLPESVTEATMLSWHKKVGDSVRRDENLVDIETEKVVLEVPAPKDGILSEIIKGVDEIVVSDDVIALFEPQEISTSESVTDLEKVSATSLESASANDPGQQSPDHDESLSPAVRRLATEHSLDIGGIPASGKDGRLTKEDVINYFEKQTAPEATTPTAAPATTTDTGSTTAASPFSREVRRQPISRMRQTIARRLLESQQNSALLTSFNEANMQAVMSLRKQYRDTFEEIHGIRLGMMSFFVKACAEGLKRFPAVNAYIDDKEIVYHDYCDVGIAVSSPRGLVVPVVRNVESKSLAQIESEIHAYARSARDGSIKMEDLTGGTFTITNGGVFGSLVSTPIVNPPQSAILGMHNILERPVAENGEVVIRPMMYLAITYDHRIIDGREAVQFLVTVKQCIEDPTRLLLQV